QRRQQRLLMPRIALDRGHQRGHQVVAALQLHVDVGPGRAHLVAQPHQAVEHPHRPGRERGNDQQGDGGGAHAAPPATRIVVPATRTCCPARILQVLRSSTAPSTSTSPLATSALPAPPLSTSPTSFSSWLSST